MNKFNYALALMSLTTLCFQSCQKNGPEPTPVIPVDTTVTFLPSKLVYESVYPEESVTAGIGYSLSDHTISFDINYPTSTSIYPHLKSCKFYYSDDGYLLEQELFDQNGKFLDRFYVERDDLHVIKRLLVERDGTPAKDTFNISFTDSLAVPAYKRMRVYNVSRFINGSAIKSFADFTYLGENLVKADGESYSDSMSQLGEIKAALSYDASKKLILESSPVSTFQTIYSYESTGAGLDSFYHTLQGKDGHYLTKFEWWPSLVDNGFYFESLWVELDGDMGSYLFPEIHKYGPLKQVKSTPPDLTFDFQNTFDSNARIVESRITYNGALRGTYKVTY